MGAMKSCLLCSLKTGCFGVAFYTFFLAILLLIFNIHDYTVSPHYLAWSRIISFVWAVVLFCAALCLLVGLFKRSVGLLCVWIAVFTIYVVYQIAFVCWNIYYYTFATGDSRVPDDIRTSFLVNIIFFGILIFFNVFAVVAVHSECDHFRAKGGVMA